MVLAVRVHFDSKTFNIINKFWNKWLFNYGNIGSNRWLLYGQYR